MRSRFMQTMNVTLTALASLILVSVILWLVVPKLLGLDPQVVLTGSMEPTIPTGSVIFVSSRAPAEVRVGDVLTFKHPDGNPNSPQTAMITHRVMSIDTEGGSPRFRTRGDANDRDDAWLVPSSHVVGVVDHHTPRVGRFTLWLRSRTGFLALVSLPLFLLFWDDIGRAIARRGRGERPPDGDPNAIDTHLEGRW